MVHHTQVPKTTKQVDLNKWPFCEIIGQMAPGNNSIKHGVKNKT